MSKYIDKAKQLRNDPLKHYNCAQAVLLSFQDDIGLDEDTLLRLGSNFGGGMKMGSVCGTLTAGAMVLGLFGMDNVRILNSYYQRLKDTHDGCYLCADLLKRNAAMGKEKKQHCDSMIYEAISYLEEILQDNELLSDESVSNACE